MPAFSKEQLPFMVGGLLLLALIGWYAATRPASPLSVPTATTTPAAATTTPPGTGTATSTATVPKQKTLPPEQPFVLPEGATAIDAYAYIQNNSVYFRSLTGKTPLNVWDANAASFHRVGDFMMYPGSAVVSDCGAAPLYSYYTDDKRLYFYQIWRTPTFRSSTVEAVMGAHAPTFAITGPTTSADRGTLYEVSYQQATTTCRLSLSKTAR